MAAPFFCHAANPGPAAVIGGQTGWRAVGVTTIWTGPVTRMRAAATADARLGGVVVGGAAVIGI